MTDLQRLLALDAALAAAECIIPQKYQEDLQTRVETKIKSLQSPDMEQFDIYVDRQREACELLAANPQIFGGEPDAFRAANRLGRHDTVTIEREADTVRLSFRAGSLLDNSESVPALQAFVRALAKPALAAAECENAPLYSP